MFFRYCCLLLVTGGLTAACPASLSAQLQDSLTVILSNRHIEGSVYHADIWIVVAPGVEWRVSDCVVWVLYNANALNPIAYNGQSVENFDTELAASYGSSQTYHPGGPAVSIDVIAPTPFSGCVVKGGANGETFRLGTLRWNVTDYTAMDYVRCSSGHPLLFHRFAHRNTDNKDTDVREIHWTQNDQSDNTWQNLYIAPTGCGNMFYDQPQNCSENMRSVSTLTPLSRVSPHWESPPGPAPLPHIVPFQYDFALLQMPTGMHTRSFSPSLVPTLLDRARCRWEAQVDVLVPPVTNYFEWQETTTGGWIYFSVEPENIAQGGLAAAFTIAVTNMARDASALSLFRDTSACGARMYPVSFKQRSEIVFNNSFELYAANPHLRWTTNVEECGGGPDCIDFYSVALHELGHYVGLAHEERNHTVVMNDADSHPMPYEITQCDADNIRRLYNPSRVGQPPDNSFDCGIASSVGDIAPDGGNAIEVLPSYSHGDDCTVVYTLRRPGRATITVVDLLGRPVRTIAAGEHQAGRHRLSVSLSALPPGAYIAVLHTDGAMSACRFFIVR